ncbi:MAG: RNA pseudouridine synthase [Sphaerochaetaceae bacterium]
MKQSVQEDAIAVPEPVVIAEERSFLVVDKPAGLPTVPLKKDPPGKRTLLGDLASLYPEILSVQTQRPWEGGAVHRLDTATSGLVVVARTASAWRALSAAQRAGLYTKEYAALSAGPPTDGGGFRDGFPPFPYDDPAALGGCAVRIGSLFRPWGEGRKAVRPVGRDAADTILKKSSPTWYVTEVCYAGDEAFRAIPCKRFVCRLSAGFRHQVRCHLAWAGWPLAGDSLYGGVEADRLGLRAFAIRFPDPDTTASVEFRLER